MKLKSVRLLGAVLFGGVSLIALSAHADEPEGWYVGGNGGLNWNKTLKTDFTTGGGIGGNDEKIKEKPFGWTAGGNVGYNWGNNIRTEVAGFYSENGVKSMFGAPANGTTEAFGGFVNVLYDFDLTPLNITLPIVPYIGGGIGAVNWNQTATFSDVNATRIHGGSTAAAYDGILGVAYNVYENWDLTADFRYIVSPAFGTNNRPKGITNDLSQTQALLGVRYTFSEPKPAPMAPARPAPTPAPAPQKAEAPASTSYLVFFDFNKYNLTSEAQRIVDNAAAAAKNNSGVTQIDVTGHTDTVGSDAYNMKLSRRRADKVKAELVKQGIPANEIVVYAKGKRDPLVPTGDGVREPQNRRVEIVFNGK